MSYELKDQPDPWYIMPLFIILILGLIVWGVSASVKYVEEEGYEEVSYNNALCLNRESLEWDECFPEGGNGVTLPNGEEQYQYVADEVIIK